MMSSECYSKPYVFIEACRSGNIQRVRQLLPSLNYKEINRTDKDGNTGLHLACIQDNYDLVLLILQSDNGKAFCSRTILNEQGLNAYQLAKSERIRSLFNCSTSTNSNSNSFQKRQVLTIRNRWIYGYTHRENANDAKFFLGISRAPWLFRKLFQLRIESEACQIVQNLIKRAIAIEIVNNEFIEHFNRFIQTKQPRYLLTLYTKEANFSRILQNENIAFTVLIYFYLNKLVNYALGPGESFRSMCFVDFNQYQSVIHDYRWAKQNDEYVLETRAFQSTSKDRRIAEIFMEMSGAQNQLTYTILCHYDFPEKCSTVFDIGNLSSWPEEQEVLILPFTLFKVTNIEMVSSDYHIISLMNVRTPRMSMGNVRKKMKAFRINSKQILD